MRSISLALVLFGQLSFAQPPDNTWIEFNNDNARQEQFYDIYSLQAGGFVLAGMSDSNWVVKTDSDGRVLWQIREGFGGFLSVIETDNGDYLVGGRDNAEYCAWRISPEGRVRWKHSYAPGDCSAVIELKAGDFILAGTSSPDGFIVRINGAGDVVWARRFRIGEVDDYCTLRTMRETEDGIIVAGSFRHNGANRSIEQGWVLKIDLDGRPVWSRAYPAHYNQTFQSMVSLQGGFALCGTDNDTLDRITRISTFCLTKIAANGDQTFRRRYEIGQAPSFSTFGLNKLNDGGVCMVGYRFNAAGAVPSPIILRVDRNGEVLWMEEFPDQLEGRRYHYALETTLRSVVVIGQNEIVACGGIAAFDDRERSNGLLVRLAPDQLVPGIFYKQPEDSLQAVLQGDNIQFVVRARDRLGREMHYAWEWRRSEDTLSLDREDTTVTIRFDSLGVSTLTCSVTNDDWTVVTGWQITTSDLFIRSHSPDTLSLTIHHGETVPFAMSVAATPGDDPTYLWTLTDWAGGRLDTLGTDSVVSHLFDHGGNYLMEGMASRGASADTVAWNIRVLSNVVAYHPDRTRLTYPQDTTVIFSVEPSEFDTGQYRYEWLVDGGWCSDSESARVGFPFLGQSVVKSVVADSAEADTIVWEVEVVERTSTPPTPPSIEGGDMPHKFTLSVSPNPFNHRTAIRYSVPNRGEVRVSAYDISGRLVKELLRGDRFPGEYSILWQAPAAGVYLIQVEMESGVRRVAKGVCLP